jgi:undecaprenyl diphosphate synthase
MTLLISTIRQERQTLMKNEVQLHAIGDIDQLPPACRKELDDCIAHTAGNKRMTLNLALSYSGRWDILKAVKLIAESARSGALNPEEIDEQLFSSLLSSAGTPDPDLLIRTGGEFRVSNFLLWEIAYAELYITERFWPDFRRNNLYQAITDFQKRDRRYGRVST